MVPTAPYVTAAEFTAHPTYLDVDDLRSGSSSASDQVAALTNILLMASAWADDQCFQPLGAHLVSANVRARTNADGDLQLAPKNGPVLYVASVAYGTRPTQLAVASNLADAWTEDGWLTLLPVGAPSTTLFVQWSCVAGFVSTALTAAASVGATSLTVADPTGILPGVTYRLWEPGVEESVAVSSTFTPPAVTSPPTVTSIPLAAPTLFPHAAGAGWSGMPADVRLAVINYAVSQLMRPDTAAEDSYPDTQLTTGTRATDPRRDGSGLVAEAQRILVPFARVR